MFPSAPIRLSRVATGFSALALLLAGTAALAQVTEDVQVPFNVSTLSPALASPGGVAVAPDGTVYVTDVSTSHNGTTTGRLIRIMSTGLVGGNAGGTGSLATSPASATVGVTSLTLPAGLTLPSAVAVDSLGDLYVGDYANLTLWKVTAPETSPAFTQLTQYTYTPMALATDSSNNLYVASRNGNIYEFAGTPTAGPGPGTTPTTTIPTGYTPVGLAVDAAGDIVFANSTDNTVWVYSPPGVITEYPPAQTETYHFSNTVAATPGLPIGMGFDPAGNLYILDSYSETTHHNGGSKTTDYAYLWQIEASATYQVPFSAATTSPGSMTVSSIGNLYISDDSDTTGVDELFYNNNPVNFGTVLAGTTSPKVNVNFNVITSDKPFGKYQAVLGDVTAEFNLAGTCSGSAEICNLTLDADFQGSTPGLRNGSVGFTDQFGDIYAVHAVGVSGAGNVALYPGTQTKLASATSATTPCPANTMNEPQGQAVSGDGQTFFIADEGGYDLSTASPTWPCPGVYAYAVSPLTGVPSGNPAILPRLGSEIYPDAVALDGYGNLYVADYGGYVFKYAPTYSGGTATYPNRPAVLLTTPTLTHPMSLAVDIYNNLYVGDMGSGGVNATESNPGYIVEVPGDGGPVKTLNYKVGGVPVIFPAGLTTDSFGNLFIADSGDGINYFGQVDLVPITGQPSKLTIDAGKALNAPDSVAFDAGNDLYIVDSYNGRILTLPFTYVGSVPTSGSVTVLGGGLPDVSSGLSTVVTPSAVTVWPNQNTLTVSDIGYQNASGTAAPVQVLTLQSQNVSVTGLNPTDSSAPLTTINVGSIPFAFENYTTGGTNPSYFSLTGCGAGSFTLDMGVSNACTTTVDYNGKGTGSLSAMLTLNASAGTYGSGLGNVITAFATGASTPPAITLSPTSGSYVGNPSGTGTLINTGGSTLYINSITATSGGTIYSGGSNPCGASLAAGSSCTFEYSISTSVFFFFQYGTLDFTVDGSTTLHGPNNVTANASYNYFGFI